MARLSASTALYLAAATFLGAIVVPVSMDLAATHAQALAPLVLRFQALDDTISPTEQKNAELAFSRLSGQLPTRD